MPSLDIFLVVLKDGVPNGVCQSIVANIISVILVDICCIKIDHVKLVLAVLLNQDEKVICIRNERVTDCDFLTLVGQLNFLDKFGIKTVDQDQVILETSTRNIRPIGTKGTYSREHT